MDVCKGNSRLKQGTYDLGSKSAEPHNKWKKMGLELFSVQVMNVGCA